MRQLLGKKPFCYAALGRSGQSITVAGEAEFIFTRDSEQPVVSDEEKEMEGTGGFHSNMSASQYVSHQTSDVQVTFDLYKIQC